MLRDAAKAEPGWVSFPVFATESPEGCVANPLSQKTVSWAVRDIIIEEPTTDRQEGSVLVACRQPGCI